MVVYDYITDSSIFHWRFKKNDNFLAILSSTFIRVAGYFLVCTEQG